MKKRQLRKKRQWELALLPGDTLTIEPRPTPVTISSIGYGTLTVEFEPGDGTVAPEHRAKSSGALAP